MNPWTDLLHGAPEAQTNHDLGDLLCGIGDTLYAGDYPALDAVLAGADPARMTTAAMVVVLRGACRARHRLPSYDDLLARARAEVAARGVANELFRGL